MKSRFAFIGLILFLVAFSPLGEILQTPLLFVHYSEHKQQDPSMDFGRFLETHYNQHSEPDSDYQKDMRLPFKSLEHSVLLKLVFLPVNSFAALRGTAYSLPEGNFTYEEHFSFFMPGSIFHPPKV